jgi:membrane protease YdiL (CAAX protease family)
MVGAIKKGKRVYGWALMEVGLLFLPSIPGLLWLWPAIPPDSALHTAVQCLVYVYFLGGAIYIGRRRSPQHPSGWSWAQLGVSRKGLGLSLACGAGMLALLACGRLALADPLQFAPLDPLQAAWTLIFYIGFVGVCEEFLFRGLLYHVLHGLAGSLLAILGSTLAFALWHIGWAGPLQMGGIALIGGIYALARWRGGNIPGLALGHGLYDILVYALYQGVDRDAISITSIANRGYALVGDLILLLMLGYLLWIHPRLRKKV